MEQNESGEDSSASGEDSSASGEDSSASGEATAKTSWIQTHRGMAFASVMLAVVAAVAGYFAYREHARQTVLDGAARRLDAERALEVARGEKEEQDRLATEAANADLGSAPREPAPTPARVPCGDLGAACPDGFFCTPRGTCENDAMVWVPGGAFMMGCNAREGLPCGEEELPYHSVTLSSFAIDRTEVTVADYRSCVDAGACSLTKNQMGTRKCNIEMRDREEHPINCVNWEQAGRYCVWAMKRLPTEAEWEMAARGTQGARYPWGSEPPDCDRTNIFLKVKECVGGTSRVGQYPEGASPFGALDMVGNVLEWVADYYDPRQYFYYTDPNPRGPSRGAHRVLRGASYGDAVRTGHHVSARYHLRAEEAGRHIGFRCVWR